MLQIMFIVAADTVNFAPGSNITLDVDGATNTITINSSGGGGSTYDQNLNTTNDVTFDFNISSGASSAVTDTSLLESITKSRQKEFV